MMQHSLASGRSRLHPETASISPQPTYTPHHTLPCAREDKMKPVYAMLWLKAQVGAYARGIPRMQSRKLLVNILEGQVGNSASVPQQSSVGGQCPHSSRVSAV